MFMMLYLQFRHNQVRSCRSPVATVLARVGVVSQLSGVVAVNAVQARAVFRSFTSVFFHVSPPASVVPWFRSADKHVQSS